MLVNVLLDFFLNTQSVKFRRLSTFFTVIEQKGSRQLRQMSSALTGSEVPLPSRNNLRAAILQQS